MNTPLSTRYGDLRPDATYVAAPANGAEPDTTNDSGVEPVVSRAYLHRHDPDTVTVHPWKDTPLGDADTDDLAIAVPGLGIAFHFPKDAA